MSFSLSTPADLQKLETHLSTNDYLSGECLPGDADYKLLAELKELPDRKQYPNLFGYLNDLFLFQEEAKKLWCKPAGAKKEEAKKPAENADDDDLDLFGEDPELEKKAAELKKKEEASKPKKKEIVLESRVVFDVKGYEVGFDFMALYEKIKKDIVVEGCTFTKEVKVVPVGFGMNKLQMTMVILDSISADDIIEQITELYPDDIQSIDIVEFVKN